MATLSLNPRTLAFDQAREREFFEIFRDYYDFEAGVVRRPDTGNYSLDRMIPLAEAAGNPEEDLEIIHVAGTKGKGSTCTFLSAFLDSAGERCGLYASPHLYSVRERFQVAGEQVGYDELLAGAREFEARIREAGLTPTLFEIMTVFAMRLFVDKGCRWCVLETGIGGVLDATNYIPSPRCTVITPVSLDHSDLLGNTVEQVAFQKAGIIKPHAPVICGIQPFSEAEAVIRRRAEEVRAPLHVVTEKFNPAPWGVLPAPPFTIENFELARTTCRVLGVDPDPEKFVAPVLWGRFQVLVSEPPVVIDAAHNADSARRLAEAVLAEFPGLRFTVVLGVVQGKDIKGIVRELARLDADFVLTDPRPPKASALEQLCTCADSANMTSRVIRDIQCVDDLREAARGPLLFTGSFFTALIGFELFNQSEEISKKVSE